MASGYAMKAKPGPDFTTSVTSIPFLFYVLIQGVLVKDQTGAKNFNDLEVRTGRKFEIFSGVLIKTFLYAMCPKNEKTPKPAKTEEKQFPMETINVSRRMLLLNSL